MLTFIRLSSLVLDFFRLVPGSGFVNVGKNLLNSLHFLCYIFFCMINFSFSRIFFFNKLWRIVFVPRYNQWNEFFT